MKGTIKLLVLVLPLAGIFLALSERSVKGSIAEEHQLAFVSKKTGNWEIWTSDLDGKNKVKKTDYKGPDYNPAWSPDGQRIAFTTYRWGGHRIGIMDRNGSNVERLLGASDAYNLAPCWSPDGQSIAYFTNYKGYWNIFTVDLKSRKKTRLTTLEKTSERSPSWSPDGTKIAFQSIRDGNWEIYVMDSDGRNQKRLTNNQFDDFMPSWSPDGRQIVFGSGLNHQMDIFIIDKDGSNLKNLTNGKPRKIRPNGESHKDDLTPVFTPDGQQIIWACGASGTAADIYIMNKDGGNLRPLIATSTDERFPAIRPNVKH